METSPDMQRAAAMQHWTRREVLIRASQAAAGLAAARALPGIQTTAGEHEAGRAIWDAHVHLSGVAGTVEQRVDGLLEYAGRMGIERLVLFMGTAFVSAPSPAELRKENDEVLRAIAHAPDRILGMVYVNPKQIQGSLAEMDRCVREGPMVGVKLWIALECRRPELDPIVRRAVELKVPLLQHAYDRVAGNMPGESGCSDVAILAARHPDASFICSHTGNDWERGIRTIRALKNVWAEVCGSDPTAGFVEMAVRELGAERVIFGSDAGGRSFASQLAKVYSARLPEAEQRLILGGNLRRLLAPALAQRARSPSLGS
jgi:predicted TIM-barrel fold metal-dependent hydrolase